MRWRRFKTQVKILEKAQAMLDAANLSGHAVPAKTLVPLLELCSLEKEDDDEMQTRWAALLANAATEEQPGSIVLPSFSQILSELSPLEARMLDWLAANLREYEVPGHAGHVPGHAGHELDYFGVQFGFPTQMMGDPPRPEIFFVSVDNLQRLQLCTLERPNKVLRDLAMKIDRRIKTTMRYLHHKSHATDAELLDGAFVPKIPTDSSAEQLVATGR